MGTLSTFGLLIVAVAVRIYIASWGHSGEHVPPMFGDFEAQRHWLEISVNLPLGDWYRQTTQNDLQYWGLDYPPLTAYVSWMFGAAARKIYPDLVELGVSRGLETAEGKMFMRSSVILCDVLVLIPALLLFLENVVLRKIFSRKRSSSCSFTCKLLALVCPSLLLIDHGHFQYNGVCIGLALYAGMLILEDRDCLGSFVFCLSLNFKQMALYYAPVFFFALLRKCWQRPKPVDRLTHLIKIGSAVIVAFILMWGPFCWYAAATETCASSLLHVLQRLFPFNRGVFEDKVANLWYALSVVFDFRNHFRVDQMAKACLASTIVLIAPVCIDLLRRPLTATRLTLSLVNCSLAFFLASFQVHEKSILLPVVPALLLLPIEPVLVGWFQVLGLFTLFPLLVKDGLRWPYFTLFAVFGVGLYIVYLELSYACPSILSDVTPSPDSRTPLVIQGDDTAGRASDSSVSFQTPNKVPVDEQFRQRKTLPLSAAPSSTSSKQTDSSSANVTSTQRHHLRPLSGEVVLITQHSHHADTNFTDSWNVADLTCCNVFPHVLKLLLLVLSLIGMAGLHLAEARVPPPRRYPDLYPALFALYGVANLVLMYLVGVYWQWTLPSGSPERLEASKKVEEVDPNKIAAPAVVANAKSHESPSHRKEPAKIPGKSPKKKKH